MDISVLKRDGFSTTEEAVTWALENNTAADFLAANPTTCKHLIITIGYANKQTYYHCLSCALPILVTDLLGLHRQGYEYNISYNWFVFQEK